MEIRTMFALRCVALLISTISIASGNEDASGQSVKRKLSKLERFFDSIIPDDYDTKESLSEAVVNLKVIFLSVPAVVFETMEIHVEFLFIADWLDTRLFLNTTSAYFQKTPEKLSVPETFEKRFWVPSISFTDCKRCTKFATGVDPKPLLFWPRTGKMSVVFRDTVSFACRFDLSFYPFDVHSCNISLEVMGDPSLKLYSDPTILPDNMISDGMPSEFAFDKIVLKQECSVRNFYKGVNKANCVQYVISFHRIIHYYLMLIFTPSSTIVVISWISFWIPADIPAPRVTLGLTSLLTLTTQFYNSQQALPPVAYIKALDVWMITCSMMVFASLMEFAISFTIQLRKKTVKPFVNESKIFVATNNAQEVRQPRKPMQPNAVQEKKPSSLDEKSRIIFPTLFALFNIVFWSYFLTSG